MERETIAQAIDDARDGLFTLLSQTKDINDRRHLLRALNTFKLVQDELRTPREVAAGG